MMGFRVTQAYSKTCPVALNQLFYLKLTSMSENLHRHIPKCVCSLQTYSHFSLFFCYWKRWMTFHIAFFCSLCAESCTFASRPPPPPINWSLLRSWPCITDCDPRGWKSHADCFPVSVVLRKDPSFRVLAPWRLHNTPLHESKRVWQWP